MLTDMTPPKEQRKCTNPVARVFVRSSARRSGWFDFFKMHGCQRRHVSLIGGELASHHPTGRPVVPEYAFYTLSR